MFDVTAASYFDYLEQFSSLMRDPVWHGDHVPHGQGQPVLLIPGFFAGDWMMAPMARWLTRIGYHPYLSGIDLNFGCPREQARRLRWRMEEINQEMGMRVAVIGHSLGGVLARAIVPQMPAIAGQVAAIGAPIRNEWTAVNWRLRPVMQPIAMLWQTVLGAPLRCGTARCDCGFLAADENDSSGNANFSSIFSRRDEVVDWRSCVDPHGHNHEVGGRHFSLIVNREVYRLIAQILATDKLAAHLASRRAAN